MDSTIVIGHINPDADTVCSAITMAWVLNQRDMTATPYRTGELNKETAFVLEHFGQTVPELLTSFPEGATYCLVDTNNPEELLPGFEKAKLVGLVDHHKLVGGLSTSEPLRVLMEPVGCTATLVYHLATVRFSLEVPKEIGQLMLACIISDTQNLTSPTTTPEDKRVAEELIKLTGVNPDELAEAMFSAKSDLTGLSPRDILMMDSKVFAVGAKKVRVSVLETLKPANALNMRVDLQAAMEDMKTEDGLDAAFLFVVDIVKASAELIVPSQTEKEIAGKAFSIPFTGDTLTLPGVVSRKKQMIPPLEAALA